MLLIVDTDVFVEFVVWVIVDEFVLKFEFGEVLGDGFTFVLLVVLVAVEVIFCVVLLVILLSTARTMPKNPMAAKIMVISLNLLNIGKQ